MAARKKNDSPEELSSDATAALPNALKKSTKKGFTRAEAPPADIEATPEAVGQPTEQLRGITTPGDIATGRGPTYEWEFFVSDISSRLRSAEIAIAGGGGGGGSGLGYVHTQSVASSSWSINHALQTKPGVTVVGAAGQQIYAEVHYPDDDNTVIVFASPSTGTAYLRG